MDEDSQRIEEQERSQNPAPRREGVVRARLQRKPESAERPAAVADHDPERHEEKTKRDAGGEGGARVFDQRRQAVPHEEREGLREEMR